MHKQVMSSFPCPRCHKERIILKQWQEAPESEHSTQPTRHTLMVCPDEECQAKQDAVIAKNKAKQEALVQAKEARMQKK